MQQAWPNQQALPGEEQQSHHTARMGLSNVRFLPEWSLLGILTMICIEDGPHKVGQLKTPRRQATKLDVPQVPVDRSRPHSDSNTTTQTQYFRARKLPGKKS